MPVLAVYSSVSTVCSHVNVKVLVVVPNMYSSVTLLLNGLYDYGQTRLCVFFRSDGGLSLSVCELPPRGFMNYKIPFTSL